MFQYTYKTLLVLLILSYATYSIELSFLTSVLVIILSISKKVDTKLFTAAGILFLITIVGIFSSIPFDQDSREMIKDFVYFLRPLVMLFAVYFLLKRIEATSFVFNVVILLAFIFALRHLFIVVINIGNMESYIDLRRYGGKQNHIELIALIFMFFTPFKGPFGRYSKIIKYFITLSFVLYLSRTMFLILFIFWLGFKGYLFLNRRFLKGIAVFLVSILALSFTLSFIEMDRNSEGFKAFLYKTKNSFSELFESIDTSEILKDRRELWEHWRAFETTKALDQIAANGSLKVWLMGFGYGEQIKIGTHVRLDGETFTELPTIHNGFINVLFKTGLFGLFLYLSFIFYIFTSYQKFNISNDKNILVNKLIIASSLYMFFNSFVITGFFRPGEFSIVLFAILVSTNLQIRNIKD